MGSTGYATLYFYHLVSYRYFYVIFSKLTAEGYGSRTQNKSGSRHHGTGSTRIRNKNTGATTQLQNTLDTVRRRLCTLWREGMKRSACKTVGNSHCDMGSTYAQPELPQPRTLKTTNTTTGFSLHKICFICCLLTLFSYTGPGRVKNEEKTVGQICFLNN